MADPTNPPQGDAGAQDDFALDTSVLQAPAGSNVLPEVTVTGQAPAAAATSASPAAAAAPSDDFALQDPDPVDTSKWDPQIKPYAPIIQAAAEKYGVPPAVVAAVIRTESNGDPKAVSSTGAQGLMQVEPDTGKDLGLSKPFDPAANIDAGTGYLAQLYKKFGNWNDTLRAYNEGPHTVASEIASDLGNATGFHTPAYTEYPATVLAHYAKYGGDLSKLNVDPGSLGQSFAYGATLGQLPKIEAGLKAGVGTLFGDSPAGTYAQDLPNEENAQTAYAHDHPVLSGVGQFAGSMVPAALTGDLAGGLAGKLVPALANGGADVTNPILRLLARGTSGALQGGVASAATSPLNSQEPVGTQAALGAGVGGLASGVLGPVAGAGYNALKKGLFSVPGMDGAAGPATAALAKVAQETHGIDLTPGNVAGYEPSTQTQNEQFTGALLKNLGYSAGQKAIPVGERTAILADKGQAVSDAAAKVPVEYSGQNAIQLKTDLSDIYSGFKHLDEPNINEQSVPAVRRSVGRERVKQVEEQLDSVAANNIVNHGSSTVPGKIISDMLAMPSKGSSGGVVGRLLASANPEAKRMGQLLQTALTNAQMRSGAGTADLANLTNAKAEYKMANVLTNAAADDPLTGTINPKSFLREYAKSNGDADVKYTPRQQELATIADTFLTGAKNPAPQSASSHLWQDSRVGGLTALGAHVAGAGPLATGMIALGTAGKMAYDFGKPIVDNTNFAKANMLSHMAGGRTSLRPFGLENGAPPDVRNALARALGTGVSQAAGPSQQNLLQQYMKQGGS